MEPLAQLQHNIQCLLNRVDELAQQVAALNEKNEQLRQEIVRTHGELDSIQKQHRQLQIAYSMLGGEEERFHAKTHLTNMIAQLDRALEALKQ